MANQSGTLTSAQGYKTLDCSPGDSLAVTVISGSFTLEYPIGTVVASGSSTSGVYALGAGQCRIACRAGSLTFVLTDIADGGANIVAGGLVAGPAAAAANSALINAMLAQGGHMQLPPGKYYVTANALSATQPGTLRGAGKNNGAYFWATTNAASLAEQNAGTTLACTSQTGWILGIDVSGFKVEGIHFQNESAVNGAGIATAGGGIRIGSQLAATGMASAQANGTEILSCSTYGCYVGVDLYSSDAFIIQRNNIVNSVKAGIQINNLYNPNTALVYDYGDPTISGNQITSGVFSAGSTGILFLAGGGIRINDNKINGNGLGSAAYYMKFGVWFQPTSVANTSVFPFTGNSVEGIAGTGGACVKISHETTTANVAHFTITGNEFGVAPAALIIQGSSSGNLVGPGVFANNTCNGTTSSGAGANLSYCGGWVIGKNTWGSMANGEIAVKFGEVVVATEVEPQLIDGNLSAGQSIGYFVDASSTGSSFVGNALKKNTVRHKYTASLSFSTKSANPGPNVFYLAPASAAWVYAAYRIKVTLSGAMSGVGNLFYTGERIVARPLGAITLLSAHNAAALAAPGSDQVVVEGAAPGSIAGTIGSVVIASGSDAATAGLVIDYNITADTTALVLRVRHTAGSASGATNAFNGSLDVELMGVCCQASRYQTF